MATPRKLGVLVAIPIKGRKLLNRTRGKQSPYIQLKLGSETKRTKASLIASDEPEWDQEVCVHHGSLPQPRPAEIHLLSILINQRPAIT